MYKSDFKWTLFSYRGLVKTLPRISVTWILSQKNAIRNVFLIWPRQVNFWTTLIMSKVAKIPVWYCSFLLLNELTQLFIFKYESPSGWCLCVCYWLISNVVSFRIPVRNLSSGSLWLNKFIILLADYSVLFSSSNNWLGPGI